MHVLVKYSCHQSNLILVLELVHDITGKSDNIKAQSLLQFNYKRLRNFFFLLFSSNQSRARESVYEHTKNHWLSIKNADISKTASEAHLLYEYTLNSFRLRYNCVKFAP